MIHENDAGRRNGQDECGLDRRSFLKGGLAASALLLASSMLNGKAPVDPDARKAIQDIEESVKHIELPAWVAREGRQTAQRLAAWRGTDRTVIFPIMTDVHSGGRDTYLHVAYLNSLASLFPFDFIADLGDVGTDVPATKDPLVAKAFYRRHAFLHHQYPGVSFQLVGNHDHNRIAGKKDLWITDREFGETFNVPMQKRSRNLVLAPDTTYGYYDVTGAKTRVIFLNSSDHDDTPGGYYTFASKQLNFLVKSLMFPEPGWTAVILAHLCIPPMGAWLKYGNDSINGDIVMKIMEDFAAGRAGKLRDVAWNFTGNKDCRLAGNLCGDSHFDAQQCKQGVNVIISQGYGDISADNLPKHGRFTRFDSHKTMLVDIVGLKPGKRQMGLFRLGAGGEKADRLFRW